MKKQKQPRLAAATYLFDDGTVVEYKTDAIVVRLPDQVEAVRIRATPRIRPPGRSLVERDAGVRIEQARRAFFDRDCERERAELAQDRTLEPFGRQMRLLPECLHAGP